MTESRLVACHECDLLVRIPAETGKVISRCGRCRAVLHRNIPNSIERSLALTLAGAILFVIANALPFLSMSMQGQVTRTTLITGVIDLYKEGMWELSILVLATTILVPMLQLTILVYVLVPLYLDRTPPHLGTVFRYVDSLRPWSMMEVFLIGIIVAVVKLAGMAEIIPGPALWSFALLIVVLAAASSNLDPATVWSRVRYRQ